jgi:hypothetical protein
MHMHYRQGSLIPEQQVTETNPLFELAIIPRDLHTLPPHSSAQHNTADTGTTG